jgi:anthranilate synthase component II
MPDVLVVDNYDSFTFNLVHLIGPLVGSIEVVRNDALTVDEVRAREPGAILLSPGPCTPREAGICLDVVRELSAETPILGVCLGHQAIGEAFGGDVVRAPRPMHGKVSEVSHDADGLFRGLDGPFRATRYHSLVVDRRTWPEALAITAQSEDGIVMGLRHRSRPVHGVQFHPESVLSDHGARMMRNFLDLAAAWRRDHAPASPSTRGAPEA